MKNTTTSRTANRENYHDLLLENHILNVHQKCLDDTETKAKILGIKNLPSPEDDDIFPYIHETRSTYGKLASEIDLWLLSGQEKPQGALDIQSSTVAEKQLDKKIQETEINIISKQDEQKKIFIDFPWNEKKFWSYIIAFIAAIESVISYKAFQILGDGIIYSFAIAAGLGIALWAFAHNVPNIIRLGNSPKKKIIISSILFTLTTASFYILSILRSYYFKEVGAISISPVIFTIINLFFFSISSVLAFFHLPTKEQKIAKQKFDLLKNEIQLLETKKASLLSEKELLQIRLLQELKLRLQKIEYSENMKKKVDNLYHESIGAFIRSNVMVRKDETIPLCFKKYLGDQKQSSNNHKKTINI